MLDVRAVLEKALALLYLQELEQIGLLETKVRWLDASLENLNLGELRNA